MLERDRNREKNGIAWMKFVVPSIGSMIQRMVGVAALDLAGFLHQKAVAGARFLKLAMDDLLAAFVGGGDEIARPLDRDLEIGDLAEIALDAARRLAHGIDHDGQIGRLRQDALHWERRGSTRLATHTQCA